MKSDFFGSFLTPLPPKFFIMSTEFDKKFQIEGMICTDHKNGMLLKNWVFLAAIFGHLTRLMKKSLPFLRSMQLWLQSQMFLSNSVDMMKNLDSGHKVMNSFHESTFHSAAACIYDNFFWTSCVFLTNLG